MNGTKSKSFSITTEIFKSGNPYLSLSVQLITYDVPALSEYRGLLVQDLPLTPTLHSHTSINLTSSTPAGRYHPLSPLPQSPGAYLMVAIVNSKLHRPKHQTSINPHSAVIAAAKTPYVNWWFLVFHVRNARS